MHRSLESYILALFGHTFKLVFFFSTGFQHMHSDTTFTFKDATHANTSGTFDVPANRIKRNMYRTMIRLNKPQTETNMKLSLLTRAILGNVNKLPQSSNFILLTPQCKHCLEKLLLNRIPRMKEACVIMGHTYTYCSVPIRGCASKNLVFLSYDPPNPRPQTPTMFLKCVIGC